MPGCRKCWAEAGVREMHLGGDKVDHYHEILSEKKERGEECTPEEQCGDWHVVLEWVDGTKHCICGHRVLGPNHAPDCMGESFRYSGQGYNRVRVCNCGAEDHDPE